MAGAGLVDAWPPTPRGAPSAYHVGAAEAGRRLGLLRPTASVVRRPPSGAGTVQRPADAPDGVKVRSDPRCLVSPGLSQRRDAAQL